MKKLLKKALRKAGFEIKSVGKKRPSNVYEHISKYTLLNQTFRELMSKPHISRGNYVWGALCGADLASNLKMDTISFVEFGVAGGNGLVELESIAIELEELYGLRIEVYGFDTGKGLSKPKDYRDLPHLWSEGDYAMDEEKLKAKLKKARLILGDVEDTIDGFIQSKPSPIAFISFDMDLYSPTVASFRALTGSTSILLPRIHCYFDDIMGYSYSEFNGERLAIAEFNEQHKMKKISPIFSLENYIDGGPFWAKKFYLVHIFDHERYNDMDGMLVKPDLPLVK